MLLSHSTQTFSIVLTGILHGTGVISKEASSRFTAIVLLSIALGLQVALARSSGIPEVPTAMREFTSSSTKGSCMIRVLIINARAKLNVLST